MAHRRLFLGYSAPPGSLAAATGMVALAGLAGSPGVVSGAGAALALSGSVGSCTGQGDAVALRGSIADSTKSLLLGDGCKFLSGSLGATSGLASDLGFSITGSLAACIGQAIVEALSPLVIAEASGQANVAAIAGFIARSPQNHGVALGLSAVVYDVKIISVEFELPLSTGSIAAASGAGTALSKRGSLAQTVGVGAPTAMSSSPAANAGLGAVTGSAVPAALAGSLGAATGTASVVELPFDADRFLSGSLGQTAGVGVAASIGIAAGDFVGIAAGTATVAALAGDFGAVATAAGQGVAQGVGADNTITLGTAAGDSLVGGLSGSLAEDAGAASAQMIAPFGNVGIVNGNAVVLALGLPILQGVGQGDAQALSGSLATAAGDSDAEALYDGNKGDAEGDSSCVGLSGSIAETEGDARGDFHVPLLDEGPQPIVAPPGVGGTPGARKPQPGRKPPEHRNQPRASKITYHLEPDKDSIWKKPVVPKPGAPPTIEERLASIEAAVRNPRMAPPAPAAQMPPELAQLPANVREQMDVLQALVIALTL